MRAAGMAMGGIDDLYQELILDHYKNRRHRGTLAAPSVAVDHNNPLCGDQVHLEVLLDGETVADLGHVGDGCSISQASASMMSEVVIGRSTEEALGLVEHFRRVMHGDEPADEDRLGRRGRARGRREVPGAGQMRFAFMDGVEGRDRHVRGEPTR